MKYKYNCLILFFVICCSAGAQTLMQPVTLIQPAMYTSMVGIQNLAIAPVTKQMAPIKSTEKCRCSLSKVPATLLSLEGNRTNNQNILLNWQITNELHENGFKVERSLSATDFFNEVGFVPASLNENKSAKKKYALNDFNNYDGISYYRLKQIDQDSNVIYSETIAVKGFSHTASLKLYPNPATTNMLIEIDFPKSGTAKLWVMDEAQKVLVVKDISYKKGNNSINMPVTSLSPGFYFIKILNNDNILLNGNFIRQ